MAVIDIIFYDATLRVKGDNELIDFLDKLKLGKLSKEDERILTNYFGIACPENSLYCGFEIKEGILA